MLTNWFAIDSENVWNFPNSSELSEFIFDETVFEGSNTNKTLATEMAYSIDVAVKRLNKLREHISKRIKRKQIFWNANWIDTCENQNKTRKMIEWITSIRYTKKRGWTIEQGEYGTSSE